MGADFLERVKKTLRRSWDYERLALSTSDLLTKQPDCEGRSVIGEIIGNARLTPGEKLTVERDAAGLVARRGLTDVVRIPQAPPDVVRGIEECAVRVLARSIRCTVAPASWRSRYAETVKRATPMHGRPPTYPSVSCGRTKRATRPRSGAGAAREREICGGLAVEAGLTSCLDLCCGSPENATSPAATIPTMPCACVRSATFHWRTSRMRLCWARHRCR